MYIDFTILDWFVWFKLTWDGPIKTNENENVTFGKAVDIIKLYVLFEWKLLVNLI